MCYSFGVRSAVHAAASYGVAAGTLLADTGIPLAALNDSYQRISLRQEGLFFQNLIKAINQPWIGLSIGQAINLTDIGAAGVAMLTAANSAHAHQTLPRLKPLLGGQLHWRRQILGNTAVQSLHEHYPLGVLRKFMMERYLAMVIQFGVEASGPEIKPLRVDLDYADPGYITQYQKVFSCPIKFQQPVTQIVFPYLEQGYSFSKADTHVKQAMIQLAESLEQQLCRDMDIEQQVSAMLKTALPGAVNIEMIAKAMHMSSRTLRRQLNVKNCNFQAICDQVRLEIANEKLTNGTLNLQQIALACGFSEAKNFAHAFGSRGQSN